MSWLLDTDVICQPAKKKGDPKVIAWLEVEQDRCYTSAVVIAQLAYWVRTKEGRQRQTLQAWARTAVDALRRMTMERMRFGANDTPAVRRSQPKKSLSRERLQVRSTVGAQTLEPLGA